MPREFPCTFEMLELDGITEGADVKESDGILQMFLFAF